MADLCRGHVSQVVNETVVRPQPEGCCCERIGEAGCPARRRSERRIKAAGFPREKSLRAFDSLSQVIWSGSLVVSGDLAR